MRSACTGTWAAGRTCARTCSTARPCPPRPASPAWPWQAWPHSDCCETTPMPDRYPGYDVLSKRDTPSWNEQTRRAINERLAVREDEALFFDPHEFATVKAIAACLVPQPERQPGIPVAALVDRKLHQDQGDGYRHAGMPRLREAWRQGLRALDDEARAAHGAAFKDLRVTEQEALLQRMQHGELDGEAWGTMKPDV